MIDHEETHQWSEAHYQVAMEAADLGMWDWELWQKRQFWSQQCKAIMGVSPDAEGSYEHFLSLIHPDDQASIRSLLAECHRTKTPFNMEYRVIWPDGSLHWVADRGRYFYDEQGNAVRLIGVVLDITAQKQAEEARLEAERNVREILESVGEAFSHLDHAWCFTYVNVRAAHMLGNLPPDKLIGQNLWEMYPNLLGTSTEHFFRQVMETRQPAAFEVYDPRSQRWYDIRSYPAEKGGITNFCTDITERKNLERERDHLIEQLERERTFLQTVMNQVPSGVVLVEALQGKLIGYNEAATRMLGAVESWEYSRYTQSGAFHVDGTPYAAEEHPLARVLRNGEVIMQEDMLYQCGDSHLIHLAINAAPIYDTQGHMLAAIAIFQDISERYELERRKDEFTRLASHELRTPLTSLTGNLQLVNRRLQQYLLGNHALISAEERTLLEHLTAWNERALRQAHVESRLVNDLLEVDHIRMEGLGIVCETGDLVQIVRDAVDDMRALAQAHPLSFEAPEVSEIPVTVDRVRIGQVVMSYVDNALKYSPEEQPVTVGIALEGQEARVWVKDVGPGLSLEEQRAIWDRFHRLDTTGIGYTGTGSRGLGLGLYICRELIQLHGGNIGVDSAVGKGSTFWFSLPTPRSEMPVQAELRMK